MSALLLALTMAAGQPAGEPYRVSGAEAPWSLTIVGGRMRYQPSGGAAIEVSAPSPHVSEMSREYRTSRLTASIYPGAACTERASGRRYADTVWLQVGSEELKGCGGAALAADDLRGTSWRFIEIDGAAVTPTMSSYSLEFGPDHFMGYSRCNRFSGRYARVNGTLTFSWIGSTGSLCPAPHDVHDGQLRRIFSGRAGPVRFSLPDPEKLLLTADVTIRLRRITPED